MDKVRLEKIMFPLFNEYEECDDIIDALDSLLECEEITEEEYDQCQQYWDELLLDWESQA